MVKPLRPEVAQVRGRQDPQASMLAFVDLETRVPLDHPLRPIKRLANTALSVGPRYALLDQFGKPMVIAEMGVSGTSQRQSEWLADAGHALEHFPHLWALVYFDDTNPPVHGLDVLPDWRVQADLLRRLVDDVASPGPQRATQPGRDDANQPGLPAAGVGRQHLD